LSLYLDASVIVPLFVHEARHPDMWAYLASVSSPVIVSSFAAGEVVSAMGRYVRKHELTADSARERLSDFEMWRTTATVSPPLIDADIALAATFVARFELALRLPDAIHIACARRLTTPLLTLDNRMRLAAGEFGVEAVEPA
jgi:uncharacterized protein